jgi:glycosyltransferase involved in cell wall biosynthesis
VWSTVGRHDVTVPNPLRVAYTLEQCWHEVPGGSAAAALHVARRLATATDLEVIGVAGRHRDQPEPAFTPPIDVRALPFGRPWLYEAWNRFEWPPVERAAGAVDVCHSTIAIPGATRAPHVVTVHDVAFVRTPERFTKHGARVMKAGLERCRNADLVLCPSAATLGDLVELDFDERYIRRVPWGVEALPVSDADAERVRATYALPEQFVLYVGTVEPRKNVSRLARATASLDDRLPLVVAGAPGWGDAGIDEVGVRFLGFVPERDLPGLYASATVFAYPSLDEGFGMPVAEAMAYGLPVVTSRGTATEETAGGAAVLVDPGDVESIRHGLTAALDDAATLADRGRARAAVLSWDATAEATASAYREVAG